MPLVTLNKLRKYFGGSVKGKKILLLGISYREDVGDTRYSPSETFFTEAQKEGAQIIVHDPLVEYWEETKMHVPKNLTDPNSFDAIVFAVPHQAYREISFNNWLKPNYNGLIFDSNNVLTDKQRNMLNDMNINLLSIGRG